MAEKVMSKMRIKRKKQKNMKKEARKMSFQDERKCCISASFGLISRRPFHYNVLVVRK